MWLIYAQEKLIETGIPPRSKFIDRVEFESNDPIVGDPTLEQYANDYPEDVDGYTEVEIFRPDGRRKNYTYDSDLAEARDVIYTGGKAYNSHRFQDRPYI